MRVYTYIYVQKKNFILLNNRKSESINQNSCTVTSESKFIKKKIHQLEPKFSNYYYYSPGESIIMY